MKLFKSLSKCRYSPFYTHDFLCVWDGGMAILRGEFCLEFIIIFFLGLTSGSPLIKVFSHEDVVLKKFVTLNDFFGILVMVKLEVCVALEIYPVVFMT